MRLRPISVRLLPVVLRVCVLSLLAHCAASPAAAPAAPVERDAQLPANVRPDHVVIVIEENKPFEAIIDNPAAPYINSLAKFGALLTNSHGVGHPSQPNYLALFSGSMQGVTNDECPHQFTNDNLAADLERHHLHFALYAEGLPQEGFLECRFERYFRKHNPASNWVGANVRGAQILPFTRFPSDFRNLPEVSFVIPDIINDMHDGTPPTSISTGDTWLRVHLSAYARWAIRHNSILIVTFDEDDNQHGNRIPTVIFGGAVIPGQYDEVVNHYDVLRTLTEWYGLEPLGGLDATRAISAPFRPTTR